MKQPQVEIWIKKLIAENNIHAFYKSSSWIRLSKEVLREQHHECQICKENGMYQRATTVHHINFVRQVPSLALSKLDGKGNRNLLALCDCCHYKIHHKNIPTGFTNAERW